MPSALAGMVGSEHCEVWTGWMLTICWLDTTFQPVDLYLRRFVLLTSVATSSRGRNLTSKSVTVEGSHPTSTTRVADCRRALSPPLSSALTSGARLEAMSHNCHYPHTLLLLQRNSSVSFPITNQKDGAVRPTIDTRHPQ
jgi:hypothetical protein